MFPANDEFAEPTVDEEEEALRRLLHLAYAGDEPQVAETFAAVTRRNSAGSAIVHRIHTTAITVMKTTIGRAALTAALSALVMIIAVSTRITTWWIVPAGALLAVLTRAGVARLGAAYYEPYVTILRRCDPKGGLVQDNGGGSPWRSPQMHADLSLLRSQSVRWVRRHDAVVATAFVCGPALVASGNDASPAAITAALTAAPALSVLLYCDIRLRHLYCEVRLRHHRRRMLQSTSSPPTAFPADHIEDSDRGQTSVDTLPDAPRALPSDSGPAAIPRQRDRRSQGKGHNTAASNGHKQESQTG